jgi:hypothetical protein
MFDGVQTNRVSGDLSALTTLIGTCSKCVFGLNKDISSTSRLTVPSGKSYGLSLLEYDWSLSPSEVSLAKMITSR